MAGLNFLIVGLAHLAIAIYGTVKIRQRFNFYALMILIVVYGLAYDNLVIASGAVIPEGGLLRALNLPRFWIHALTTPTMMISAFGFLRLSGSKFGQSRFWHTVTCLVATGLILLGGYINILNLTLSPVIESGVNRYVNSFVFIKGPPIPAIGTIAFVIIFGIMLWRNTKFPWLFVGSAAEIAAASARNFILIQNIGEIAFAAGLVFTLIFVSQYQQVDRRNSRKNL